jgi:hypothetical protein
MSPTSSRPFLGTTNDPNHAFPGIVEVDLKVTQDPYGEYLRHDWQRTSSYTKGTIPQMQRCANPKCQQGGIDLQQIVNFWESGEYKFACNGHEGTPKGRRIGDPCDNVFTVRLSVVRNEKG